jgi:mono/diheme cytochrome c family protein
MIGEIVAPVRIVRAGHRAMITHWIGEGMGVFSRMGEAGPSNSHNDSHLLGEQTRDNLDRPALADDPGKQQPPRLLRPSAGLAVLVLCWVALAQGQGTPAKGIRSVEAERFVLRDEQGTVRAELRLREGQPGLTIFDEKGFQRIQLALRPDGTASLVLQDKGAAGGIAVQAGPDGTSLVKYLSKRGEVDKVLPASLNKETAPVATARHQRGEALFRKFCISCHQADGKGKRNNDGGASPPNFTVPSWHTSRTDADLAASILEGRGSRMPAFHDRIDKEQAADLVVFVRAFNPVKSVAPKAPPQDVEKRLQELQKQYQELEKQLRQPSSPSGK